MRSRVLLTVTFGACYSALILHGPPREWCDLRRCPKRYGDVQDSLLRARRSQTINGSSWPTYAGHAAEQRPSRPLHIKDCDGVMCKVPMRYPQSRLRTALRTGALFLGDSTTRRLFVRLVSRLEGITDQESEMLQDNAREWIKHADSKAVDYLRKPSTGEPLLEYDNGRGTHLKFKHTGVKTLSDHTVQFIQEQPDVYGTVVLAIPTSHILYHPNFFNNIVCHLGPSNMEEYFRSGVRNISRNILALKPKRNLVILSGVAWAIERGTDNATWTARDKCPDSKCANHACDSWLQNNEGVEMSTKVLREAVEKEGGLFVDMYSTTARLPLSLSDRVVHYTYPVLDDQLAAILASFQLP